MGCKRFFLKERKMLCLRPAVDKKKNKPVNPAGYPRRAYFSYPTYYAIGERVHGSLDEPILNFGSWSRKR